MMTQYTTSKDGTKIAYSKTGNGKPLILVDGAFCHRKFGANEKLPQHLSDNFTVYSYDRRGRSESRNTLPYSPQKEYEDLQAVINEAGGNAHVYGISSGAALALEAANAGVKMEKLALYEAPYITDNSRSPLPENYLKTITELAEQGENGKAVKYFMRTGIGLPAFVVWMMQWMPAWKQMKQLAHTLPYDIEILGNTGSGKPLSKEKWSNVKMPTLVISGSKSAKWSQNSMQHLATVLPNAKHQTLIGQSHIVNPKILAQELIQFFR
ncbi:alpha/beta fold hydrolase [Parapedobacter sp. 10938]|uniref:alpha/beta fold hydrolase n=1 Tax=Parapedobacter flavus TaxID=3110225 RepID=UPI002DBA62DD|nr:alpha/beta hydrolase [Parapedobacter sp. 10938]MEC3880286.1 alpha/beta hydrolase [Parapedobacter sp. 10938]